MEGPEPCELHCRKLVACDAKTKRWTSGSNTCVVYDVLHLVSPPSLCYLVPFVAFFLPFSLVNCTGSDGTYMWISIGSSNKCSSWRMLKCHGGYDCGGGYLPSEQYVTTPVDLSHTTYRYTILAISDAEENLQECSGSRQWELWFGIRCHLHILISIWDWEEYRWSPTVFLNVFEKFPTFFSIMQ